MRENFLDYGILLCDNIIEQYPEANIPSYEHLFNYHNGVLLSGMEKMSRLANKEKYENYIKLWADNVVKEDGTIPHPETGWCSLDTLDFRQPGLLLFNIYKRTKDLRYAKAIKYLTESLKEYPVTKNGTFWHAKGCRNEVWLDGIYMASPLMVMYAKEFDRPEFYDMAAEQVLTMYGTMRDDRGLLHHGYDCTKQAPWADKVTGYSREVWGRAMGWFVMAIAEILENLPQEHKDYEKIAEAERDILNSVCRYQHESGRWFQVIDKTEDERNWLENSASSLITAALAKCLRIGILPQQYIKNMEMGVEGVLNTIRIDNGRIYIPDICIGTCIESGTLEHYYNRPVEVNDKHGTGTFLIMLAEAGTMVYSRKY